MLSAEREALYELLYKRVDEARGKAHLEQLLRSVKEEQNVPLRAFRVTGTMEELLESVKIAADGGWLTERRLADLVDQLEENGGQHIFLFDLSPDGRAHLTRQRLGNAFTEIPARPTPGLYADLPAATRTHFCARPDGLIVKQIFRAEYWDKDEAKSRQHSTDNERAVFHRRHERRAINLFIVHPETNTAEIRVDRIRGQDDTIALELLNGFLHDLSPVMDAATHIHPIDTRTALQRIAAERNEVYLNADDALDPSAQITLANRRARDKGPDIRDHAKYALRGPDCTRNGLSPYWVVNGDADNKVYTSISIVEARPFGECGKIYVSATLEPHILRHVLDRIRHFARAAP